MRTNTAQTPEVTPRGVLIFAAVSAAVAGALWWASVNAAPARSEQARLDAAAVTAENVTFCRKHVADAAAQAGCAADLSRLRDNHLKRFADSTAGWL